MDKELKVLQEVICCGCPYGADNMEVCDIHYCDKKEAFGKVKDAYKNVKKDLAGRQKKIEELSACHAQMKASRDCCKNNWEAERLQHRALYGKYTSLIYDYEKLKFRLINKEDN